MKLTCMHMSVIENDFIYGLRYYLTIVLLIYFFVFIYYSLKTFLPIKRILVCQIMHALTISIRVLRYQIVLYKL